MYVFQIIKVLRWCREVVTGIGCIFTIDIYYFSGDVLVVIMGYKPTENKTGSAKQFATDKFEAIGKKNHFLDVFNVLQNSLGVQNEKVLIAGLLHDTLEDTETTYEEISKKFSIEVADMVQEVSHPKNYNHEQKLEYYEKIKTISPEAKLIKMADFTSHLQNFIKIYERNE